MNGSSDNKITKIGIFYDGNYFYHVSNYYNYTHPRRARVSISGLHEFVKEHAAALEGTDAPHCRIVDAHYFRGRLSAREAEAQQRLLNERVFDDVLMNEGIVTHYLPVGPRGEKGIDVWLALEAFELAMYKRYSVLVLVACDGDYVPLVRKLNALGTRVMILGWDFEFVDQYGETKRTVTSVDLLAEATYPVQMHTLIDDKARRADALVNNLFVQRAAPRIESADTGADAAAVTAPIRRRGRIQNLKEGYGFITTDTPGRNLFFCWNDLSNTDFNSIKIGDEVDYALGRNMKGECATNVGKVAAPEGTAK
jgi:cold shock CspA family protein/uncharacterized LabA/DUF88 family protein